MSPIGTNQFKVGERYSDAVGRKWKVLKWVTIGDSYRVFLVKRGFRTEIAVMDTSDRMTVLVDHGFTTLYAEEEKE